MLDCHTMKAQTSMPLGDKQRFAVEVGDFVQQSPALRRVDIWAAAVVDLRWQHGLYPFIICRRDSQKGTFMGAEGDV
jgi:hypothetical protein